MMIMMIMMMMMMMKDNMITGAISHD